CELSLWKNIRKNVHRKSTKVEAQAAMQGSVPGIDLTVTVVVVGSNGSRRTFGRENRNTMREKLWEYERRCLRSKQSRH
ncbi:jg2662, partial [Pararge aegeria aegeria]